MEQTKYINVADLRSVLDKYNANEIEFEGMVQELNNVIGSRVKRINRTFSRLTQTAPVFSEMQEFRKKQLESLNDEQLERLIHGDWKPAKIELDTKEYKCTDCQELNVIKDNGQITVGFCKKCGHPLWNEE